MRVEALRASLTPSSSSKSGLPAGVLERPSLAVFAEVRINRAALAEGDDEPLDAIETTLSAVWAELSPTELIVLGETATTLLAVSNSPPDEALAARVIAACVRAHRRVFNGPDPRRAVELGIAVHVGALHVNETGAVLPSGLARARSWSPAGLSGVAASRAALAEACHDKEPVAGAAVFFWVER